MPGTDPGIRCYTDVRMKYILSVFLFLSSVAPASADCLPPSEWGGSVQTIFNGRVISAEQTSPSGSAINVVEVTRRFKGSVPDTVRIQTVVTSSLGLEDSLAAPLTVGKEYGFGLGAADGSGLFSLSTSCGLSDPLESVEGLPDERSYLGPLLGLGALLALTALLILRRHRMRTNLRKTGS